MFATTLKFLRFQPRVNSNSLAPAPSTRDWEEIAEALKTDATERLEVSPENLTGKTVKILTTYRGGIIYAEGGLSIVRYEPKTCGVNEYLGWPIKGLVENVIVNNNWYADIEYM
jgi:hypothetical protein